MEQKQERFCHEYIVDSNAKDAAVRAGYSPRTAASQASRLLTYPHIQQKVAELISSLNTKNKIDAEKLQEFLTSVIYADIESDIVVIEATGDGYSQARTMSVKPNMDQRLVAAAQMAKILCLGKSSVNITNNLPVFYIGENELAE